MHDGLTRRLQICLNSTGRNRIVFALGRRESQSAKETMRILPA